MNSTKKSRKSFFLTTAVMLCAALLVCSPAAAQTLDFIGSAKQSLSTFMQETVPFDEKYEHYEGDGGSIDLEVYTADKIEKIVFSSIQIEETNVSEESVFIYPAEGYEFPVFWANMTRFGIMTIFIFDFLPLQDLIMSPEYGEQYIQPLKTTKDTVTGDILKNKIRDKSLELDSLAMYVYSPYRMVVMVSFLGALKVAEVVDAYAQSYISLCNAAQELPDGDARDYATDKLAALRNLLKENDPGYPIMVETFGEAATLEIMEVIF